MLTPLAVDPGHPFPYISDLSLSLAVTVRDPDSGERLFARIKVPPVLPRLWEVGVNTYVLLEQVIAANLDALFPGMEILEHHLFRVTRNADLSIEEEEAADLLMAIEEELRKRRFGKVVRLEIERSMPHQTRALLMRGLGIEPADVYEISGMLDLTALNAIADLDIPSLHVRALAAGHPGAIRRRPIPTRSPTSSRPSARATSSSTTRTSRSRPRSSASSSRRPRTRTC